MRCRVLATNTFHVQLRHPHRQLLCSRPYRQAASLRPTSLPAATRSTANQINKRPRRAVQRMTWCGALADGSAALCVTSTAASSTFLLTVLLAALVQLVSLARKKQQLEKRRELPWSGSEMAMVASFGTLVTLHLAAVVVLAARGAAPVQYFSQAALLGGWCLVLGMALLNGVRKIMTPLRLLSWEAALLYCITLFIRAWNADSGRMAVFLLALNAVQLCCVMVACLASLRRLPAADADLQEQLLLGAGGRDVEQGEQRRERSWYSLIGTALKHVWPTNASMQLRVVACLLIIVVQRVVNLAVPILYRDVINRMSEITNALNQGGSVAFTFMQAFYPYVMLYMIVAYVQGSLGSAGLLRGLRSWLWQPVSQNAYKRISLLLFDHMLDLDLRFHLMRKTGEVSKVIDRGTDAMQDVLSTFLFGIGPQMFDIIVSCAYLASALQPWIALIVFVLLITYIPLSIYLTEQKGRIRKEMNQYSNDQGSCLTDALLNYETVKNFGNEEVESAKFSTAVDKYNTAEYSMTMAFNVIGLLQGTIVFCATALGLVLCVKDISEGKLTVGDLVLFLALMSQLYGPLNYFASLYRSIQKDMMNMDQMLAMLDIDPGVKDRPDAKEFVVGDCSLEFDHVSFGYSPDAPVLRDVSFKLDGGKTLALVGATGSGKSTALRLIFRYFDPTSGAVKIDGQDLQSVKLKSFRRQLAVVPQDTVLFNMSILENIRYGRPGCSDEEVEAAASSSAIHDAITTRFPKGYETIVGERGLRLSGGEKQRVAFARALLKNPGMLLLDEATSSLDTITERRIQSSLAESRAKRTTVIVAHRLSTIMDADLIVCFQDGTVVEMGSHAELMEKQALYYDMWSKQEMGSQVNLADNSNGKKAGKERRRQEQGGEHVANAFS